MNDLRAYFENNTGRLMNKWVHYFEAYDRHFSRFRGKAPVILEFGVWHGGSLQMWKDYFGDGARIIGVDIDPRFKFEEAGIEVIIGSQEDPNFLTELKKIIPRVDVLIDDGGHTMHQQITTFEHMYDHVKDDGVYLCEDTHTSYWSEYGGRYKGDGTFVEYSKKFIDELNAHHVRETDILTNSRVADKTHSVHFYDSMVFLEKRILPVPTYALKGVPQF